ncbi:MAG TPA: tyrosine--tRNA ligase [Dehalococcoidia bacterium]|nr:tyrosine--tRNA ligase [Dehalococcoidia bacterium]
MATVDEQMAVLMRGVEYGDPNIQRTMEEDLRERLKLGRPLRVYCGFDPTFTGLTLGNMVPMLKLRQFQRFGHEVTFLMGTMTATVGDPSDKSAARQQLTLEEVQANCQSWLEQAYRVLDREKTLVRYNADWLAPLTLADVVQLASNFTVAEFLAHETFKRRMDEARPLYIHEFIYALMQAYDAHHMKTDVQVGGSDQLFNIMAGRKLQQALGEAPLIAVCTPLLIGTDGAQKMSKSVGNSINMDMTPSDMYGKLMSIPDSLMPNYYTLLTDLPPDEIDEIAAGKVNPMQAKKRLAHEVVALLHDDAAADAAQEEFERVIQGGGLPSEPIDLPVALNGAPTVDITQVLSSAGAVPSRSEARRLISQGGIAVDGVAIAQPQVELKSGAIVRIGRHRFYRVVAETEN